MNEFVLQSYNFLLRSRIYSINEQTFFLFIHDTSLSPLSCFLYGQSINLRERGKKKKKGRRSIEKKGGLYIKREL
jgi:hypothetical protein